MRRIAIAAAALALVACGESWQGEGTVVGREYDDADQWFQPPYTIGGGQSCSGGYGNQPRVCTPNPVVHMPGIWHHAPERWLLQVRDTEGETHTVEVPESIYDTCRDGQRLATETMECKPT